MPKIFIVEDDDNIRELILYALKTTDYKARGFETADDFWQAIVSDMPDLLLLDIMLPGDDGITILKNIKNNKKIKDLPVIMLTAKNSEYDRVMGLDLGADDYITKPFSVLELISRIRAVLRRSGYTNNDNEPFICGNVELDAEKHLVTVDDTPIVLTFKEFELLQYLMENKGIVLTRDKIMSNVWGIDFEGESRTVDMHIKTLRQKLENGSNIIKTVRGVGYKLEEIQ